MRNRSTSSDATTWRGRPSWTRRPGAVAVAASAGLLAAPARAAESLVLLPDYGLFDLFGESTFGDLWIMIVVFIVLIYPLNQLIFKPIFRTIDERAARIDGARTRSGQLEKEADGVLDRYETAIREARVEAETTRQTQLTSAREEQTTLTAQARSEAEGDLERARADLLRSLEEARATLRTSAEDLAQAAAEQVLGRALS